MGDSGRIVLIWHRRDLRLHDNELYAKVALRNTRIIPFYALDPEDFAPTASCTKEHPVVRVGPFAARFLLESLQALRQALRALGSDLIVRHGRPREALPGMVAELRAAGIGDHIEVVWHDEAGVFEAEEAAAVRIALSSLGQTVSCRSRWGCSLWHPEDLPLYAPPSGIMEGQVDLSASSWTAVLKQGVQSFRRKAAAVPLRQPSHGPKALPAIDTGILRGTLPILSDLLVPQPLFGLSLEEVSEIYEAAQSDFDPRSAHPLEGGEAAALQHLMSFVAGPAEHCNREGGGDADGRLECSAKVSAYLAFGCISPRHIHAVCCGRSDKKAMWLPENMEMRDFWIFYALAHGRHLFARDGTGAISLKAGHWSEHSPSVWRRWALGRTGLPLLDAAMREMLATGYTSNRCRQTPVSLLAKDLKMDWRLGAEFYQWLLVDHDVSANWGNWRYFAGVGCDPKYRQYKALSQGLRYDSSAVFVKKWLPQLECLPAPLAHLVPIRACRSVQADAVPWLECLVDPLNQMSWHDQQKYLGDKKVSATTFSAEPTVNQRRDRTRGFPQQKGRGKGKNNQWASDIMEASTTSERERASRRWRNKGQVPVGGR
mmetsp:Transcript_64642/g.127799  ORF Transcript_64642/g.127799 Transcript_64642/m.127799 type:complete len:600 (+) Transcript_64642:51-1850(+)|eukprot:CAMPEP_0172667126 /NCGR_PEP_ID=MMETSP1074-20121228/8226_1 /TAXON_ID=2916 /ORGANISM="Ceratium fusus, Strain PA161109" /LENGTH=599 /DNA_ID=CAMNT_0013483591 /DNA_START=57 /DNA_END=1856 /DNA_ORIENTATION=-